MDFLKLPWLPECSDWVEKLRKAATLDAEELGGELRGLATARLDFLRTSKLDRLMQREADALRLQTPAAKRLRLAVAASCTVTHLIPAIRVGALRRDLWVDVYEAPYGTYRQALMTPDSELYAFQPDVLLLIQDPWHLVSGSRSTADDAISGLRACWQLAKQHSRCTVIQQTVLPVFPDTLGNNECVYPESRAERVRRLNEGLAKAAVDDGVLLLDAATWAARTGLHSWYDPALWHSAKQETSPQVSPLYGDLVGRLLGALRGRSGKCLVLDLDNTLWGGVVGDDGWSGITLGQGNALGEAYIGFQEYALALARRGIILAICSKNDEKNARAPFERHPDMMLRLDDIACFVANWEDKATNLRRIAKMLNIGLDALVFADDNPFERNLVRQELPAVAVPELPEDPALYASTIAGGGYFEGFTVTADDVARVGQYRDNAARVAELEATTDLPAYLRNLDMELIWGTFDEAGLPRITQLVNKSNQYNLTTRRYNEAELREWTQNEEVLTYQLRLRDRLGDNGMISVIIARPKAGEPDAIEIDTWLMSCRVLGRQVETAALNLLVEHARSRGYTRLVGIFIPTEKNEMVRNHYLKLGFELHGKSPEGGAVYELPLPGYTPFDHFITVREA